jgi:hypothetical protein
MCFVSHTHTHTQARMRFKKLRHWLGERHLARRFRNVVKFDFDFYLDGYDVVVVQFETGLVAAVEGRHEGRADVGM